MGICQVIWIGLITMSLGCHLARHGEPRTGSYNFVTALISGTIEFALLYFGGFFG